MGFLALNTSFQQTLPNDINISQSGIPVILPTNGTIATNGTVTLGAAINLSSFPQPAWVYFPAGAVVGGVAGLYYAIFSTSTVAVVYTNYQNPANPCTPFTPTTALVIATGSNAGYTTLTSESTLVNITLPGNLMGANGKLTVEKTVSVNNNAGVKTDKTQLAATAFGGSIALASGVGGQIERSITNRGDVARQVHVPGTALGFPSAGTATYTALNTGADAALILTATVATPATDSYILEAYSIWVLGTP